MAPGDNSGLKPSLGLPWPISKLMRLLTLIIWPCQGALSGLISLCLPTSIEKADPLLLSLKRVALGPLYIAVFLLSLPAAVIAMPLRCFLCLMKKPYQYSIHKTPYTSIEEQDLLKSLTGPKLQEHQFGIGSANLCLLPECLSRINNLSDTAIRAKSAGERIVIDQFFYGNVPKSVLGLPLGRAEDIIKKLEVVRDGFTGGLATHFPPLDFLCLQEVFDWNYNKLLRQELHKVFPYVLHDVGVTSYSSNYFLLNSGLLFASRHPVLQADFKFYSQSVAQCIFISKGLLMIKVLIGEETESKRYVGYIFTTHLQAYQGSKPVIYQQLDNIVEWIAEFKKHTEDSRDCILFDIVSGDFNFDNLSPVFDCCNFKPRFSIARYMHMVMAARDSINRTHPIFDEYYDPCRVAAGQDQPWSVGTELKQCFMHESTATTPESLKASASDPVLRHRHLVDADILVPSKESLVNAKLRLDQHGNIQTFPEAGMRRIDYILSKKDRFIDITGFQFVTRLASLTDHIPVAMTFRVKA